VNDPDTYLDPSYQPAYQEARDLLILTGPPGAGKSTYSAALEAKVYAQDLQNKAMWRDHCEPILAVLVTSAPDRQAKEYWMREAVKFGFVPRLVVYDPGRAVTIQRLIAREMESPEGHRRRLTKAVQRWYKEYSPHAAETRITEQGEYP